MTQLGSGVCIAAKADIFGRDRSGGPFSAALWVGTEPAAQRVKFFPPFYPLHSSAKASDATFGQMYASPTCTRRNIADRANYPLNMTWGVLMKKHAALPIFSLLLVGVGSSVASGQITNMPRWGTTINPPAIQYDSQATIIYVTGKMNGPSRPGSRSPGNRPGSSNGPSFLSNPVQYGTDRVRNGVILYKFDNGVDEINPPNKVYRSPPQERPPISNPPTNFMPGGFVYPTATRTPSD